MVFQPLFANLLILLDGGGSRFGLVVAFLLAAGLVVLAGIKLSAYGDALGERTGLGAGLVGMLFLAAVTSLPELVVSTAATLSASLAAAAPGLTVEAREALLRGGADLAVGNMLGSNSFNLVLFAVMDLAQGRGAFLYQLSRSHIMAAASGQAMLGLALLGFALGTSAWTIPGLQIGPVTPLLAATYLAVMILQQKLRPEEPAPAEAAEPAADSAGDERLLTMPAVRFYGVLVGLALLIVIGGIWLARLGDRLALPAEQGGFGLGQSFVGTIFLAMSTSLPELVVSLTAVRLGSFDLAVGNVLGSNIFNMVILFTSDLGLRGASLFHYASRVHLLTIALVLMLTSTLIVALVYRSTRSFARIGLDVWIMIAIYLGGNVAMYVLG